MLNVSNALSDAAQHFDHGWHLRHPRRRPSTYLKCTLMPHSTFDTASTASTTFASLNPPSMPPRSSVSPAPATAPFDPDRVLFVGLSTPRASSPLKPSMVLPVLLAPRWRGGRSRRAMVVCKMDGSFTIWNSCGGALGSARCSCARSCAGSVPE